MEKDILTFIEVDKNVLANLKNIARFECEVNESQYLLTVKVNVEVVDRAYEYTLAQYFFFYPQNPLRILAETNQSEKIKQFCTSFLQRIVTFEKRFVSQDDIDELFLEMLEELSSREFYTQVYNRV
jgi:hypothetical protein